MTGARVELYFEGADGGVGFAANSMAKRFCEVVHGWPLTGPSTATTGLFAEVQRDGKHWQLNVLQPEPCSRRYDPINCICDLIVELNWSRLRQRTDLMCLHAAGIEIGDALIVIPSGRRAGKSTLTAELARRGYRVFTDDVLAVELDQNGMPRGLATGVSPRLRLPLPPNAPCTFLDWVDADPGPCNRQYKYLTGAPTAGYGEACPLGAILTLDRVDDDVDPSFEPIEAGKVLQMLIYQNFGRFSHSGRTLAAFEAIARDLPCLRLTYGRFDKAAAILEEKVAEGLLAGIAYAGSEHRSTPDFDRPAMPYEPGATYRHRAGYHSVQIKGEALIADSNGIGIFHLGASMLPIWLLLEEAISSAEIMAVLCELYPDVAPQTISADVNRALRQLYGAGLIEKTGCQQAQGG